MFRKRNLTEKKCLQSKIKLQAEQLFALQKDQVELKKRVFNLNHNQEITNTIYRITFNSKCVRLSEIGHEIPFICYLSNLIRFGCVHYLLFKFVAQLNKFT